jgi:hypothetical protein
VASTVGAPRAETFRDQGWQYTTMPKSTYGTTKALPTIDAAESESDAMFADSQRSM